MQKRKWSFIFKWFVLVIIFSVNSKFIGWINSQWRKRPSIQFPRLAYISGADPRSLGTRCWKHRLYTAHWTMRKHYCTPKPLVAATSSACIIRRLFIGPLTTKRNLKGVGGRSNDFRERQYSTGRKSHAVGVKCEMVPGRVATVARSRCGGRRHPL